MNVYRCPDCANRLLSRLAVAHGKSRTAAATAAWAAGARALAATMLAGLPADDAAAAHRAGTT